MKTYTFYFRIEKEAGMKSNEGIPQSEPAYVEICFETKKKMSNKEINEAILRFRKDLAEQLKVKVWHIVSISEKEYMKHLEEK
ncbi:hypothetical protein [Geosporobacter ferrireducens]|uniref:Uncharacterized protein n=1 Tax=Geosporobacter ferrireducens TaxID=1424294 RepID=A0A1D8GCH9_9FIRM|nr:hypothetical protein [Geosporobacter ferrireducens]AOT68611.1 hypothetical protein Gferi_02765 [Geosporobacter ferrireducens]MTI54082.1 hypothetical protein [Geosporobacter ferrireducens]